MSLQYFNAYIVSLVLRIHIRVFSTFSRAFRLAALEREIDVACVAMVLALLVSCVATVAAGKQLFVLDGRVRVQALSPTLLRIEPRGPRGFEDRTTNSRWSSATGLGGAPLRKLNDSATEAWLAGATGILGGWLVRRDYHWTEDHSGCAAV